MKATFLSIAIVSLFLTSCVSSMVTADNNSAATELNTELTAADVDMKEVALAEVPTMVLAAVKRSYPNESIRQTTRFSAEDKVYYEFQLQNKRKKPISVVFNANAKEERSLKNLR